MEGSEWSVFCLRLSSSNTGFGMSSVDEDANEMSQGVEYVRKYKAAQHPDKKSGLVVIMGHSTGSQDVLHYLYTGALSPGSSGKSRAKVDGVILQAPDSDRQVLHIETANGSDAQKAAYRELIDIAKKGTTVDGYDVILPYHKTNKHGLLPNVPFSSKRFLSLASPDSPEHPLEDDLFSSDFTDERLMQTFGAAAKHGIPMLILESGSDEFVPSSIDKKQLLTRWECIVNKASPGDTNVWDSESGIIPGASHSLNGDDQVEPRKVIVKKVTSFLRRLEKS